MTARPDAPQIAARQFTYCSAFYPARITARLLSATAPEPHEHFLVMTPDRADAHARAVAYATERWGAPKSVNVYPRTYVREARKLYAAGDFT